MSETKREVFLDKLRVAATMAVVLLHTVTGIMDTTDMSLYQPERKVFLTVLDLVCWCVPIFILISGYLFLRPEREITFQQMLGKYCRRIVLALFLFGVPFACMEMAALERTFRPEMLWKAVVMTATGKSWSHLWYLYLTLLLYLMTPAVKSILKRIPVVAVYVLLAGILLGSSILPFVKKLYGLEALPVLPDEGIYFFYYICGYLFSLRKPDKAKTKRAGTESGREGCIIAVCAGLLAAGMAVSRLFLDYGLQMAYNYPFTVLLALLLFAGGLQYESRRTEDGKKAEKPKLWKQAGSLCFTVYLLHPLFLNIYYKFLNISPLSFSIGISLPAFFLAILAPSVLCAVLLCRIPFLRRWVL